MRVGSFAQSVGPRGRVFAQSAVRHTPLFASRSISVRKPLHIGALLTEASIEEAAHKAGVGSRSIYRWLREDEAFQAAYNRAKREVVRQAQTRLQQATGKAVAALIAVIDDPLVQASARVSAAKAILEYAIRAVEIDDLEARIQALEQVQKVSHNGASAGWR